MKPVIDYNAKRDIDCYMSRAVVKEMCMTYLEYVTSYKIEDYCMDNGAGYPTDEEIANEVMNIYVEFNPDNTYDEATLLDIPKHHLRCRECKNSE